jgi:anti-sigma regulatory factor (Ser/Thr protein kinase)
MNLPVRTATSQLVLSRTYPGTPDQVRQVRDDLRRALDGCPAADDLILCASELATNAVRHSRSRESGGTFTVRCEIRPDAHTRLQVEDDGGPWSEPSSDPIRGRGLEIVRALTSRFTITPTATGRAVSATFDWPSA